MVIFLRIWLILIFMSSTSFATPIVNENVISYKIFGNSGEELQNQMNTFGPKNHSHQFNASTKWFVSWNYGYQAKNNFCELTSLKVNLHIFYILPIWMNYADSHPSLQNKWENCFVILRDHEIGHGNNGKKAAKTIENALLQIAPQKNCEQLKFVIDRIANRIIQEHLNKDFEYDTITDHGRV